MLPIERAEIWYPDGSVYHIPDDGTWAEAPPFGVQCVVYYHVSNPDKLQRITKDGGQENSDIYIWLGEGDLKDYKLGLWMDSEGYYRIYDLASKSSRPEV